MQSLSHEKSVTHYAMKQGEAIMSRKLRNWLLAGSIVAGVGAAGGTASFAQPAEAPTPSAEEALTAEAAQEARRAAAAARVDAVQAEREARRASEEIRQRMEEVQGQLARAREGNHLYTFRAGPKVEMEKAAYLGVTTSSVPAALREHLKLQRGFGLVVDTIDKDSAAAQAGVQRYDILQKLNDQVLVNSQQLGVLVRSMKPGDEVRLTFLRSGETKEVTVKLAEKELPVLSDSSFNFAVPGQAMWTEALEAPAAPALPPIAFGGVRVDRQGRELQVFGMPEEHGQSIFQDGEMTLTITEADGKKSLLAKDTEGQTLFEGEIDTQEQRETLPKAVADKLGKFEEKLAKIPGAGTGRMKIRIVEP